MKKQLNYYIKRKKWLKAIPNILTVCNSLCGFAAILLTLKAYKYGANPEIIFVFASCLIIGAMVFDALDGFAARMLNAASLKGIQMDSLADMVTFGVAPAVLVAVMAHIYSATWFGYWIAWALSALYLACSAHRLAKYNVQTLVEKKSSKNFSGLPSPGGAAAVCSLVFLFSKYDSSHEIVRFLPIYVGLLGVLMVSGIRYRHVGKWLVNTKRNKSRYIFIIAIFLCLVFYPALTAAAVINIYVIWGFVTGIFRYFNFPNFKAQ
ncbi:MAG: phosphatidylcholine/phosphatidylserine synthase [Victivallales bacterium]|nr:phosphatidylcholine/phosphatidylserine synthase [Victivallales bacterium]MCF7888712.1 phosphatidylcholine/phosphatidylserine synthase [Victivallales bacterium]